MRLQLGRAARLKAEAERRERRIAPVTAVSVAAHVLLVIAVASALSPAVVERFFAPDRPGRVTFVTVAPATPVTPPAVSRPPARAGAAPQTAPPLVAPREVPSELPAPRAAAPGAPAGPVTGPLAGGTGATSGVAPTLTDPRVWTRDSTFVYAPKTPEERLDSALTATIRHRLDSMSATAYTPNKFERGDWTVERNGKKYGIDQQFIHLGKFSIPTALLALLPFNKMQANPGDLERQRTMSFQRADIMYHAQAAISEQEFREAVRAVRDRKDREHKALAQSLPSRKGDPRAITSPGERPPQ